MGFPGKSESSNVSRDNVGREIGLMVGNSHRAQISQFEFSF